MKHRLLNLVMSFGMAISMALGGTLVPVPIAAAAGCQLNSARGNIQHVIYVQFDNTHFLRDTPNVPSDLEQMPHLLNFIRKTAR